MLFTWGMLAGLGFLFVIPQETSDRMQLTYARVFRWPLAAGHGLTLAARPVTLPPDQDRRPDQEIQNIIANLQAQLREAQRQNEVLANLRNKLGRESAPIQLAPVIVAPDPARNELIISRGTEHGLAVGQFVVSLNDRGTVDESVCVIGTLSSVEAKTAKVKLITAPGDPKIAVSIGDLSVRPFLEGRGGNTARIPRVETRHKISKGDPVYAQRAPGLDVPIITGRITHCQVDRNEPFFWDIAVEPVCDLAGLREVAVVVAPVPPR
jgi:cell shape-determining protein MreC